MFDIIAKPLGQFLNFIYNTIAFHSYGLAIILFTIFIKLILLPLAVKQYRSMARMQDLQPHLQDIQKKYKNDKEKLNQETMKLYQENKVNPAGGCLPLLVQMPILISLYWVIQGPLKYMMGKSNEIIEKLYEFPVRAGEVIANMKDISIINFFTKHPEQLPNTNGMLAQNELIDLNMFGVINLGMVPSYDYNQFFGPLGAQYVALLFIPILAALTTYLSVKFSATQTPTQGPGSQMQNSMTKIMPFVTAFFAFSVPAGLGLYWIVSNIFQILQQVYMNKFIIKKREVAAK